MLFQSYAFLLFLPATFLLHWILRGRNWRNAVLLFASYFFYAWWDWRFLSLILISTAVDYFAGRNMQKAGKKNWLILSILVNLGILGFFKYSGFFLDSWYQLWNSLGLQMSKPLWNVVLPVGISFYTFQTLSYTIDCYYRRIEPVQNLLTFASFVSFFPQLVAGPIERASHLIPQIANERFLNFNNFRKGIRLMLIGFMKKVLIADTCAIWVDLIFGNSDQLTPPILLVGAILFSFQIYCDFSGYTDIARGTARLFSIDLSANFNRPYFARNIGEFWRRWHISLTTWFRDYVYIPLGGGYGSILRTLSNVIIVFLVSGLWHGANWTFLLWGVLHATLYIPTVLRRRLKEKNSRPKIEPVAYIPVRKLFQTLFTFGLVTLAWIPFRADNVAHAFQYFHRLFDTALWEQSSWSMFTSLATNDPKAVPLHVVFLMIFGLVIFEFISKKQNILRFWESKWAVPARWLVYGIIISQVWFRIGTPQGFIYFQF